MQARSIIGRENSGQTVGAICNAIESVCDGWGGCRQRCSIYQRLSRDENNSGIYLAENRKMGRPGIDSDDLSFSGIRTYIDRLLLSRIFI